MKKIFLYSIMALASAGALTSCNDGNDVLTDTRVTYYADIQLLGDEVVVLQAGDEWTDPGVKATIDGKDVSDRVVKTGRANANEGGINSLTYTVTNDDGFSKSAFRTVYVYDKNNFQSAYEGACSYGTRSYSGLPVSICKVNGNVYHISDALGGFYAFGRYPQYLGDNYYWADGFLKGASNTFSLGAYIALNDDNSVEVLQYDNWYWGSDVPEQVSGTYDPATGTIELLYDFGAEFKVILTK
ncbi:MAG: DUF5012 domain-containing protein [Bacteroidales bacterium]|nr:DUF5012 domain-containing protein [Bacteroidales bacterium]